MSRREAFTCRYEILYICPVKMGLRDCVDMTHRSEHDVDGGRIHPFKLAAGLQAHGERRCAADPSQPGMAELRESWRHTDGM